MSKMSFTGKNGQRLNLLRTVFLIVTFVFASSVLFGQAIFRTTLDYFERCEYALFADEPLTTRDPVDQVVELKFVGEWVQKDMRLLLPVRYEKPLQVLAGDKENYVGAECVLTRVGPDVTELKGRILFTILDKQENNIKRIKLDIKGKHLPYDTLVTVHSQKAKGDNGANTVENVEDQARPDNRVNADDPETKDAQEKAAEQETSGDAPDSAEGAGWNWLVTAKIRDVVVEEGHRVY